MKAFDAIIKLLAALAAIVGAVYVVATYGDKIVAWAKDMMAKCPCECDCTCEEEDVAEEIEAEAEEEAPAAEEIAEVVAEEAAPVAEEADFEG